MSEDGRVMATRSGNNNVIQCYEWLDLSWQPRGAAWSTPAFSLFDAINTQQTIALSLNGNVLAFGDLFERTVRVFDWQEAGSIWEARPVVQLEQIQDADTSFSFTLALSSTGNTMAVGVPQGIGKAQVLEWDGWGKAWTNIKTWYGISGRRTGSAVALSSDGRTVAIGAVENAISTLVPGMVRVYRRESATDNFVDDSWTQVGQTLVGVRDEDRFGYMLALNGDGQRITVGAPGHDAHNDILNAGRVVVYEWNSISDLWNRIGQVRMGTEANENLGTIMSLSESGDVLATSGVDNGVQIHRYDDTRRRWSWWGLDWDVSAISVSAVALAGNGRVVSVAGTEGGTIDIYQAVGW